jgi:hypothetical protein
MAECKAISSSPQPLKKKKPHLKHLLAWDREFHIGILFSAPRQQINQRLRISQGQIKD